VRKIGYLLVEQWLKPYFVYKIHPLSIYKLDRETGEISPIKSEMLSELNITDFRGSAGLIEYKNGWLGTTHEVYFASLEKIFS